MNPNEKIIRFATGAQCAQLSGMVAVALAKKFDGALAFSQAQIAITDKDQFAITELAEKFANEIFAISIDPWSEEKAKISHFYKTCFQDKKWKNPNWEQTAIPTGDVNLKRLEFVFSEMTAQEVLDSYAEHFGKGKVWKAWSESLTEVIDPTSVQPRPKGNYAMLHVGGDESDLLGKSYDDGIDENIIFMTPLEGIISTFRYCFETGKMYDVKGLTRFSTLDCYDFAMHMSGSTNGRFNVGSNYRGHRDPRYGLRQIVFQLF